VGAVYCRVWELDKVLAGDLEGPPLRVPGSGQSRPRGLRVFPRTGVILREQLLQHTGVSNIFRYEVASGAVEAVSNAESGFFRPVPLADGKLVVLTYTAAGFVPRSSSRKPLTDGHPARSTFPGRLRSAGK